MISQLVAHKVVSDFRRSFPDRLGNIADDGMKLFSTVGSGSFRSVYRHLETGHVIKTLIGRNNLCNIVEYRVWQNVYGRTPDWLHIPFMTYLSGFIVAEHVQLPGDDEWAESQWSEHNSCCGQTECASWHPRNRCPGISCKAGNFDCMWQVGRAISRAYHIGDTVNTGNLIRLGEGKWTIVDLGNPAHDGSQCAVCAHTRAEAYRVKFAPVLTA